jgi:hypothetical protein
MLVQGNLQWEEVVKGGQGSKRGEEEMIYVSTFASGKKKAVRISMPAAVAKSSGFVKGDYINVKYTKGICQLQRTNDRLKGYGLSRAGLGHGSRPSITFTAEPRVFSVFFPNGKKAYNSSTYESRPNFLEFLIGENL